MRHLWCHPCWPAGKILLNQMQEQASPELHYAEKPRLGAQDSDCPKHGRQMFPLRLQHELGSLQLSPPRRFPKAVQTGYAVAIQQNVGIGYGRVS
jgi:hypothetical protein